MRRNQPWESDKGLEVGTLGDGGAESSWQWQSASRRISVRAYEQEEDGGTYRGVEPQNRQRGGGGTPPEPMRSAAAEGLRSLR
nr:unnamed protein product [Digitaria exilis]